MPAKDSTITDSFLAAIRDFRAVDVDRAANWIGIIRKFEAAFESSRIHRAARTPRLNILEVFGLKRREVCHSRVVAWFLNENASHEQGSLFMDVLLSLFGADNRLPKSYDVWTEKPDRVDIAAFQRGGFAVFIENKVDHFERDHQIADLQRSLVTWSEAHGISPGQRFAAFLTENGRMPVTHARNEIAGFLPKNLKPLSRIELFNVFQAALARVEIKSPLLEALLDGYLRSISNH